MKSIKHILFSMLTFVFVTSLFYVLSLFISIEEQKLFVSLSILILLAMFLYSLVCFITGNSKMVFIKGRFRAFIFMVLIPLLAINFVLISAANAVAMEQYGRSVSVAKKIEFHSVIIKNIIERNIEKTNMMKMNQKTYGEITFYYNDTINPQESIEIIRGAHLKAEEATNQLFGKTSNANINVIFKSKEQLNSKSELKNISGLYEMGNEIFIIPYNGVNEKWRYEELFMHEFTHYRLNVFMNENKIRAYIPHWFNEGIAGYIGYDGSNVMLSLDKVQDFRKLDTAEGFEAAREVSDPYLQSYYAVDKIIKMKGNGVINSILLSSREKEFYEAFRSVVGVNIETFQAKQFKKD